MADAAALAPGQKAALGLAVGELLMSRRQDRYSVADLMAQLAARGLDYAEPAVVQARRAARGARAVCSGCCLVICADPLLLPYGPTLHGNELDIHFFCASLCSKGCAACAQAAPAGGNRLSAFTCAGAGTGGDGGRGRDRHGAHHVRRRRAHDLRGRVGPGTTCSARPRRGAARRGPRAGAGHTQVSAGACVGSAAAAQHARAAVLSWELCSGCGTCICDVSLCLTKDKRGPVGCCWSLLN